VEAQDLQSPGYCTLLFCKPAQMVICIPESFPGSHPPTATMSQVWILLYPFKWACFSCFSCATDAGRWTAWGGIHGWGKHCQCIPRKSQGLSQGLSLLLPPSHVL